MLQKIYKHKGLLMLVLAAIFLLCSVAFFTMPVYAAEGEGEGTAPTPVYVAQIGDDKYESLQDAVDHVTTGVETDAEGNVVNVTYTEIKVIANVIADAASTQINVSGKCVVIDLNGYKLEYTATASPTALITTTEKGHLILKDSSQEKTGTIKLLDESNSGLISNLVRNGVDCSIIIQSGNYYQQASNDGAGMLDSRCDFDDSVTPKTGLYVEGGNFTLGNLGSASNGSPWLINTSGQNEKNAWVSGGTFNTDIFHQYYPFEVDKSPTVALKNNGDGTYTVVNSAICSVEEKAWSGAWYTNETGYLTFEEAFQRIDINGKQDGIKDADGNHYGNVINAQKETIKTTEDKFDFPKKIDNKTGSAALDDTGTVTLDDVPLTINFTNLTIDRDLTVPTNTTINVSGNLVVEKNASLTINGTVNVTGDVEINADTTINGKLNIPGVLYKYNLLEGTYNNKKQLTSSVIVETRYKTKVVSGDVYINANIYGTGAIDLYAYNEELVGEIIYDKANVVSNKEVEIAKFEEETQGWAIESELEQEKAIFKQVNNVTIGGENQNVALLTDAPADNININVNINVGEDIVVNVNTTINGTVNVTGKTTINADTTISGTLNAKGGAEIFADLDVDGTVVITGDATILNDVAVCGVADGNAGKFNVTGDLIVKNNLVFANTKSDISLFIIPDPNLAIDVDGNLVVEQGKNVTIGEDVVANVSNVTLPFKSTLTNNGTLDFGDTTEIQIFGTLTNNGTIKANTALEIKEITNLVVKEGVLVAQLAEYSTAVPQENVSSNTYATRDGGETLVDLTIVGEKQNVLLEKDDESYLYESLSDAIGNAANSGDVITVLANGNYGALDVNKNVTIDLNKQTCTLDSLQIYSGATLTIKNGTILVANEEATGLSYVNNKGENATTFINNQGTLILQNVVIDATGAQVDCVLSANGDNSNTQIVDSGITAPENGVAIAMETDDNSQVYINNYVDPANPATAPKIIGKIDAEEQAREKFDIHNGIFSQDLDLFCESGYHTVDILIGSKTFYQVQILSISIHDVLDMLEDDIDNLNAAIERITANEGDIGTNASNIANLVADLTELKGKVSSLDTNSATKEELNKLEEAYKAADLEINNAIGALQTAVSTLQTGLADATSKIAINEGKLTDHATTIAQHTASLTAINNAVDALKAKDVELSGLITALQSADDEIKASVTALQTAVSTLQTGLTDATSKIAVNEGKLTDHATTIAQHTATLATINNAVEALKAKDVELSGLITALQSADDEIKASVTALQTAVSTLQTGLTDATSKIAVNEGKLTDHANKITQTATDLDALETVVKNLSNTLAKDYATNVALTNAVSQLETKIEGAKTELNRTINTLTARVDDLETGLASATNRITANEGSISANVTAINKNANDLLALQGVVDALEDKVDENNTTLINSIATLKAALESADGTLQNSIDALETTLNSEVSRLEGLISGSATDIVSITQDIANVASDLNDLVGVVNTIKTNLEVADYYLEKEIADLEVALTSADDAIKASVTELGAKLEEKVNELNGLITANKNGIEDNAGKIDNLSAELTALVSTVSELSARVESDYATKELLDQANASLLAAMQLGDKQVKDELNGTINGLIAEINKIKDLNEKQQSQIIALLVAIIVVSVVAVGAVVAIVVNKKSKGNGDKGNHPDEPDPNDDDKEQTVATQTDEQVETIEQPQENEKESVELTEDVEQPEEVVEDQQVDEQESEVIIEKKEIVEQAEIVQSVEKAEEVASNVDEYEDCDQPEEQISQMPETDVAGDSAISVKTFGGYSRKSQTFEEKMNLADEQIKQNFNEITQKFESFKKVKMRVSKKFVTFTKGRTRLARITMSGKTIKCYFALEPSEFSQSKYHHKDTGDKSKYEKTPFLLKVRSGRSVKYAKQLIDKLAEKYSL